VHLALVLIASMHLIGRAACSSGSKCVHGWQQHGCILAAIFRTRTSTATRDPKDVVIAGVLLGYTLCVWSAPRPAVANISVARRVGLMTRLTSSSCPWAFCMHKRFLDSHQCSSILCKVHRQDKEKLKSTQHVAQQMPLSFQQASAAAYSTDMQAITNSQSSPTQVASHSQSCGQVQVRLRG
jgi:hypothetical protein